MLRHYFAVRFFQCCLHESYMLIQHVGAQTATTLSLSPRLSRPIWAWKSGLLPQVYTFFLGVYKTSVVVGVGGYALLVLEIFGVGVLLRPLFGPTLSIQMLWYGLYFGVLGRDCAEVVSDTLVSSTALC